MATIRRLWIQPQKFICSYRLPSWSGIRRISQLPPSPTQSFPVVDTCPPPTCACEATPAGLDIDRERSLSGTAPSYSQHVIISTGRSDWKSKIEDEEGPNLARELKALLGPKGRFHDPSNNILITNSSSSRKGQGKPEEYYTSVQMFPHFRALKRFTNTPQAIEALVTQYLLPNTQSGNHPDTHEPPYMVKEITVPNIFICGHSSRDARCGTIGPLLLREFKKQDAGHPHKFRGAQRPSFITQYREPKLSHIKIKSPMPALISHVGGHAFAGNVIVYIPPHWQLPNGTTSPLAGKGIWYGRVEPKHVQGLYKETVVEGRVIKELFRGGVAQGGGMLSL